MLDVKESIFLAFFSRKIKSTALSSCFGFQEEIFVSVARTCLKCIMNTNFLNTEVMPVKDLKIKTNVVFHVK